MKTAKIDNVTIPYTPKVIMQKLAAAGEPQQSQTKFSLRLVEESLILNKIINGN